LVWLAGGFNRWRTGSPIPVLLACLKIALSLVRLDRLDEAQQAEVLASPGAFEPF